MSRTYIYRKPIHGRHYHRLRRLLVVVAVLLLGLGGAVGYLYYQSSKDKPSGAVTSKPEEVIVSGSAFTTKSDYFQFSDNGKWVLKPDESNANKFVYLKYRGEELQHLLTIYVDKQPPSSDLEATRVLPVRLVNNNSFALTNISEHCGKQSTSSGIKPVNLNGTTIICRSDSSQFVVAVALIGGDQNLAMQRSDKTPITIWIIYRDLGRNPNTDGFRRVIDSFQTL